MEWPIPTGKESDVSAAAARDVLPVSCEALECRIAAYGVADLGEDECAAIRKSPEAHVSMPLAPSVARHCDEQTLATLFAVGEAMRRRGLTPADCSAWGIVCSSRYLGRSFFSQSLAKFDREGPWTTSIQVVPHRSLHSPSSTLSLALGCHGPNLGVGGGGDGEGQALLSAVSLLESFQLPGLWLVLAGWSPELSIGDEGRPRHEARCHAIALALQAASAVEAGQRLRIVPDADAFEDVSTPSANRPATNWLSLLTTLLSQPSSHLNVIAPLCDGLRIELIRDPAAASIASDTDHGLRAAG